MSLWPDSEVPRMSEYCASQRQNILYIKHALHEGKMMIV